MTQAKMNFYLRLISRYIAAMAAAYLAFCFSFFLSLVMITVLRWMVYDGLPDFIWSFLLIDVFAAAAFLGVIAGTFLLERGHRRFGAAFLSGVALICYLWFGVYCTYVAGDHPLPPESWFFLLGCLAAIGFRWEQKPHNNVPKIAE